MEICHSASVKILDKFLKSLGKIDKSCVLEVACGDGRLSKDLLSSWFEEIDMFDQCPKAVKLVN